MGNLSTSKVVIISIIVGLALLALLVFVAKKDNTDNSDPVQYPISFIEYSDFQCPACGLYYPIIKTIKEEFKDDIVFEYKHYPLITIHEYARAAAIASEAAREQGMFEEYHDILFENQENLTDEDLLKYAKELGLDVEKFQNDLEDQVVIARVDINVNEAESLGLTGTPTFLINGERFNPGSDPETRFRDELNSLVSQAKEQEANNQETESNTE